MKSKSLLLAALLVGCQKERKVSGVVTDIFGNPLDGVTVMMEGHGEQTVTDASGSFTFPLQESPMRFLAGKDGFIRGMTTVQPPASKEEPVPSPKFELYPKPEDKGFYAVSAKDYIKLGPRKVKVVGTELRGLTGIQETGDHELAGGQLRFIYSSGLRPDEIARLDLRLHNLDFVESVEVPGVLGKEPVTANLWVAEDSVKFDLEQMSSEDVYLITTADKLDAGVYAFHTEGVLTSKDVKALDKLPKELQVAYSFEVK